MNLSLQSRGLKTIVPIKKMSCTIGQRRGFSNIDYKKINEVYNCQGYPRLTGGGGGSVTTRPKPRPTVTQPVTRPKKKTDYK